MRVKNVDLLHRSCTVVMHRRKSASPVRNVLRLLRSVTLSARSSYIWVNTVCKLTSTGVIDCHECNSTLKHETVGDTQSHEFET